MSKARSITDLVTTLQQENETLKGLARLANQYTKQEFGLSVKELHEALWKLEAYERKAQERGASQQPQRGLTEGHAASVD